MENHRKAQLIAFVVEEAISQGCLVSIEVDGESCVEPTSDKTDILAVISEVEDGRLYFFKNGSRVGTLDFEDCIPSRDLMGTRAELTSPSSML